MVDILNPNYFISELFGNVVIFAIIGLTIPFLWFATKKKLPFQLVLAILFLSYLMLPIVFEGFLSWIPLIIIVVGFIVGTILNRFLERT